VSTFLGEDHPVIVSAKSHSPIQHFKCKSSAVDSADLKRSTVNMPMLEVPMGTVCILTRKLKSAGFELSDNLKDWKRYLVVSSSSTCHLHDSRRVD
jgi:phosphoribosylcarboxyaminoimidazole (NCAIR) mutase